VRHQPSLGIGTLFYLNGVRKRLTRGVRVAELVAGRRASSVGRRRSDIRFCDLVTNVEVAAPVLNL
jgi:hypothetical protein